MAVPTNTQQTYATNGTREHLEEVIFNISPTETPFTSKVGKTDAKNTYVEWQIDTLDAASADNAVVEGDDTSADAATTTTRVGNYTQLMDKVVQVSSTNQAVKQAGRKSELVMQTAKRGKELKRDIEMMALSFNASNAGNASTARKSGGVGAWLETNTDHGTGGSVGGFSGTTVSAPTAAIEANRRDLTEAMFKDIIAKCWNEGGDPTMVFANAKQKQAISGFNGIATLHRETSDKDNASILGAVDLYISDFGEHKVCASRFMPTTAIYCVDPDLWSISYLQEPKIKELSKTGHSDRRLLSAELTLISKNEAGSGGIFDLRDGTEA